MQLKSLLCPRIWSALTILLHQLQIVVLNAINTGRKLNVYKTFRRHLGCLLNVFCTINLRCVFRGREISIAEMKPNNEAVCKKLESLISFKGHS